MRRWVTHIVLCGLMACLGVLGIASANLLDGLALYVNFDQGEGATVTDLTGNGNHGTVNGDPQWVPGIVNLSIELDGDGDWIEVADDDSLDVGEGDITMMLWMKQAADQVDWPRPISKMPLFGTNGPGFDLITPGAQQQVLAIFYGMSGGREEVHAGADVADGEWHHVVALKEDDEGRIYLDGELAGSGPLTPMDISNDYPLIIGGNAEPAEHTLFAGIIDEVGVYTRALSEEEIGDIMANGLSLAVRSQNRLATRWGALKQE